MRKIDANPVPEMRDRMIYGVGIATQPFDHCLLQRAFDFRFRFLVGKR